MGYAETVGGLELARGPWLVDPCSNGILVMTVRVPRVRQNST